MDHKRRHGEQERCDDVGPCQRREADAPGEVLRRAEADGRPHHGPDCRRPNESADGPRPSLGGSQVGRSKPGRQIGSVAGSDAQHPEYQEDVPPGQRRRHGQQGAQNSGQVADQETGAPPPGRHQPRQGKGGQRRSGRHAGSHQATQERASGQVLAQHRRGRIGPAHRRAGRYEPRHQRPQGSALDEDDVERRVHVRSWLHRRHRTGGKVSGVVPGDYGRHMSRTGTTAR